MRSEQRGIGKVGEIWGGVGDNTHELEKNAKILEKINTIIEQCRLHLEDDKGTFGKTFDRTNEDIIKEILVKLCGILIPFTKHCAQ